MKNNVNLSILVIVRCVKQVRPNCA